MTLQQYAAQAHATATKSGFWEDQVDANFILAKLALVHSEVSEILEAYRKQQGAEAIATEFADAIIRLVDLFAGMQEAGVIPVGLNLDFVMDSKMKANQARPPKHGNLI